MEDTSSRGVGEGRQTLVTQRFNAVVEAFEGIFSVPLELPDRVKSDLVKKGKEFCVGLLENPVSHAWWPQVRHLGGWERLSLSGSLFLLRKILPSPPDPRQGEKHMALMKTPAPLPPPDYIQFVEKELDKLFPIGWDRGYKGHVYSHAPTSSACLQYTRSQGGARRWLAEQGQDWFSDFCLGAVGGLSGRPVVRYQVVATAGKQRGVTVSNGLHHTLGPLHRTLYDYLSQFGWLLRGEARGRKFSNFRRKDGEVFVSGDYEAATDNLSLELTRVILARILSRSRVVPSGIRELALASLSAEIQYPDKSRVVQQRGQLMGNFLSFPLLCLHNYLAFKYSIPRDVPLRINGDDIVFRAMPHEVERWEKNVGAAGLVLSAGKTLKDSRNFSLNSSFFRVTDSGTREVPVIRASWLMPPQEGRPSGDSFTRFIRNWKLGHRRLVGALWLHCHRAAIQATGRSVRGLGIPADNSQLHTAGLAPREAYFRGFNGCLAVQESPIPSPPRDRTPACDNWVMTHRPLTVSGRQRKAWDVACRSDMSAVRWQLSPKSKTLWEGWWSEVRSSGLEESWLNWRRLVRRVHRMGYWARTPGHSPRWVVRGLRCLNLRLRPPEAPPPSRRQWVPRDELPFVSSSHPGLGFR